jgi:hypothetical protein
MMQLQYTSTLLYMYTPDYYSALYLIVTLLLLAVLSYHQWNVVHYAYLSQGEQISLRLVETMLITVQHKFLVSYDC